MGFDIMESFNVSVDMVRLKTSMVLESDSPYVLDFKGLFDIFMNDPNCSYKEMTSIKAYRHNFFFKDYSTRASHIFDENTQCSFWVGAQHNSSVKGQYSDIVIEFNPNKCQGSEILSYILRSCFIGRPSTTVQSIDLAIDIPLNIKDVHIIRDYNCSFRTFDLGGDNKTYYQRERGSNGSLKLYNKKRESDLDYELTRLEITYHIKTLLSDMPYYTVDKSYIPSLRLTSNTQMTFGDLSSVTGTDKVLLLACMEHPEYLKELSRKKREKIESLLNSLDSKISFCNFDKIDISVRDYFTKLIG